MSKTRDYITDRFLELMEQDLKWKSPTMSYGNHNYVTKSEYKGVNRFALFVTSLKNGWSDNRWMTFNQITEKKYHLKKGSKGVPCEFYSDIDKRTNKPISQVEIDRSTKNMTREERRQWYSDNIRTLISTFTLFNGSQIDGIPELEKQTRTEFEIAERAERVLNNSEAKIEYDGKGENYYSPKSDTIHLTDRAEFRTEQVFYSTAFHEIGHSTGKADRLNRDMSGIFGSEKYALEELRAEIASMFMQSEFGLELSDEHISNHGAYVQSWMNAIKKDDSVLIKAIRDAEKITDYVVALDKTKEKDNAPIIESTAETTSTATATTTATNEPTTSPTVVQRELPKSIRDLNERRLQAIEKNVPEVMKAMPNWAYYKIFSDKDKGKLGKCNLGRDGKWCRCNTPSEWMTFEEALTVARANGGAGLAFAVQETDQILAYDIDHAYNDKNNLNELPSKFVDSATNTYVEKSVSGKGIHIFTIDSGIANGLSCRNDEQGLELYRTGKWISITGDSVNGVREIAEPSKELEALTKEHYPKRKVYENTKQSHNKSKYQSNYNLTDGELVAKIERSKKGSEFSQLMRGQVSSDHSVDDFKLMNMLAFFSNCDKHQMERVFASSGLYRESKGDKYLKRTIDKACESLRERPSYAK